MSYRKGFEAFVKRFQKRFPEPEFIWELDHQEGEGIIHLGIGEAIGLHICGRGAYNEFVFKCYEKIRRPEMTVDEWGWLPLDKKKEYEAGKKLVFAICGDLLFGIRLSVNSPYTGHWHVFRRPCSIRHANQYGMRRWLENKPRFVYEGTQLAAVIRHKYQASKKLVEESA